MNVIQIGSNKGNDDTYEFVSKNRDEINLLILIDPFSNFNEILLEQYSFIKNVFIENVAIIDDSSKNTIMINFANGHDELSSIDKAHIVKHNVDASSIQQVEVKCCTINDVFEKYNISKIDKIFIDTEGFDDKIIKSINFDKYKINAIEYENLHINYNDIKNFLTDLNYEVIHKVGLNGWSDRAVYRNGES